MIRRSLMFIVLILIVLAAPAMAGPTVSGTLTLDGKAYPIQYVRAVTAENPFEETKEDVQITLTDIVPPEDSDLNELAMAGKIHGIVVTINDQKEPTGLVLLGVVAKSGNQVCDFEPVKIDAQVAEGRVFMKEPDEAFGRKYQFDIKFSTPVKDLVLPPVDEKTGTALPAGGGEPGAAYLAYDKAMASGDLKTLLKYAPDDKTKKQMSDPRAKEMLEMMKSIRATGIKILKGFVSGNRATLQVEGKEPEGGAKTTAQVRMVKVNGQWCVEKERWKSGSK